MTLKTDLDLADDLQLVTNTLCFCIADCCS